jgi:tetratricopeptide (TPR) repeat protein
LKKNVPFLVAAILFSLTACSSHEADARKVFERANKLAFEGRSLEATSFGAAFEKYRAANARIAEIKEKYPETKFSQGLSQSSWQLGPFLWDRFSEEVLPEVKMKAIAESTPLACADHFAKKLKEDFERVETLSYLAGAAYQDGDGVRGERLISQAEKACEKLPRKGDEVMNSLEDGKLAIAQAALKAGQIERAKGIIEKYGLKDLLAAELALALVARGNPEEAVRIVDESNNRDSLEITVLAKSAVLLSRAGKREGAAALLERAEKSLKALVYSVGMPASSLDEAKTDLALGFCENKETARVLLLFGPHWVPGFFLSSAPALDELYKCCQEQGIASSILRSADQAISPLPEEKMDLAQLSERSISLGNLAYLQWKLGEQKKGRENLAEALRIEKKIGPPFSDSPDDRYRKAEAVLNLVNICQRIGFESEALDELSVVFRLVKEAPPYPSEFDKRDGTMIDLAMAYARSGKISECQSSIQALRSNSSLCAAMVQLQPLFKASKERGNYGKLLHALVASGLGVQ